MISALHTHEFKEVARRDGNRVRYACSTCPKLGPWIRLLDETPAKSDQRSNYTVSELRALAKEHGLSGYSKDRREVLIDRLTEVGVLKGE